MSTDLMEDCLGLETFAAKVDRHPRTVRRWMNKPDGLPYIKLGNQIILHIPTARDWMFGRMRRPNSRREVAVQAIG